MSRIKKYKLENISHVRTILKMEAADLVKLEPNPKIETFTPGDTVRVGIRVTEGQRTRTQVFEGVVIRNRGAGPGASFTVRRVSHDVGVERTFLIHSPAVEYVERTRRGLVKQARLYYLRGRSGRAARIKEDRRNR
jgi:large subunit ribosomal protein L19